MTHRYLSVLITLLFFVSTGLAQDGPPKAAVHEVTDTYFGKQIIDPYRWMEDAKSPETANWMKAQADYSRGYLDRLPIRPAAGAGAQLRGVAHHRLGHRPRLGKAGGGVVHVKAAGLRR